MSNRVKAARGRADKNQRALKERAINLGFFVVDLSPVGGGVPDLLVSTPLEMWLVEVKRLDVRGLSSEFKERQVEFYEKADGYCKDMLVWYELGDVDLLYLLCERAGHFYGQNMSAEADELCSGRTANVLSPEPERRGGGHLLPTNLSRVPRQVQNLGEGFTSSLELLSVCEVSKLILSEGGYDGESKVLEDKKRGDGQV